MPRELTEQTPCPKCQGKLCRREHPARWRHPPDAKYWFIYWFMCDGCGRFWPGEREFPVGREPTQQPSKGLPKRKSFPPQGKKNGGEKDFRDMTLLGCIQESGKLRRQAYAKSMAYEVEQQKRKAAAPDVPVAALADTAPATRCSVEGCTAKACPSGTGRCSHCDYLFTVMGEKPTRPGAIERLADVVSVEPKPASPPWTLEPRSVEAIRRRDSNWVVRETVAKRRSACRACGGMIEKDEPRLSFLITGRAGEDREAHMHLRQCTARKRR
jgi:hypothetical protein